MIDVIWLWAMLAASCPLGAFIGYLVFAGKMNATYTRGRRDGWTAHGVYERELRNGRVIEMVDEPT